MTLRPKRSAVLALALCGFAAPALAQSNNPPSHIPTRKEPNGPFGTEWAKPGGAQGSYIYNDPRLRDPNRSLGSQRKIRCPAPLLYDPASGRCR